MESSPAAAERPTAMLREVMNISALAKAIQVSGPDPAACRSRAMTVPRKQRRKKNQR